MSCVATIENAMREVEGIIEVSLQFSTAKLTVEYDEKKIDATEILHQVTELGYDTLREEMEGEEPIFSLGNRRLVFAIIAGSFMFLGLLVSFLTRDDPLFTLGYDIRPSSLMFTVSIFFGGYHVSRRVYAALKKKTFVIDSLMMIGAIGAVLIDAFGEGAAVLFLFSLAELLEEYSVERSRKTLNSLVDLTPKMAHVKHGDHFEERSVDTISVGEVVMVRSGEGIGIDGIVVKGTSSVNQASITGESLPVSKGVGDTVFAGTINLAGSLEIEATKEANDTALARIIKMVESAEEQKAPTERFIDGFAKYYTPLVVVFAITVATLPPLLFGEPFRVWFYKALLLLLISCPCALALSTPISIVSGITNGAKNGVLFKGGLYVEKLAGIDTFAFDKTGTLTEGKPSVTDILTYDGHTEKDVLSIASSLECHSEHPLGKAIIRRAEEDGHATRCVEDFTAIPGKGLTATIGDEVYLIGSRKIFSPEAIEPHTNDVSRLEDEARTIVFVGTEDTIIGMIGLTDRIRDGSAAMVEALHRSGISRIVMLTGDNERTASVVARAVAVDEFHADLLPEDKVAFIEKLGKDGAKVAMVGDGVNDAPALAMADLGIAMGVAGSDTALEVADIGLMEDDVSRIPYMHSLGKRTMKVVKQNIIISVGVKLMFAILVFPGLVTLWMAVAIGDMGVSLSVILNALRLSRVK